MLVNVGNLLNQFDNWYYNMRFVEVWQCFAQRISEVFLSNACSQQFSIIIFPRRKPLAQKYTHIYSTVSTCFWMRTFPFNFTPNDLNPSHLLRVKISNVHKEIVSRKFGIFEHFARRKFINFRSIEPLKCKIAIVESKGRSFIFRAMSEHSSYRYIKRAESF